MDALLARDVAWLAASVDRNLMAKHVLGMFAGFLYAWYAAWSMKPEWVEVLIGLGLIGVNGSLARLRASASEDRPAGREPHRRSRGPDHRAGKTRTRKSTRHRREFEKPAEIDRENSRYR
jgi:short subunit dehydrogenase-like uncharacterized protein